MLSRRDLLKTLCALLAGVATTENEKSIAGPLAPEEDLTGYINPFIGTGAHGHTYPGATVPFGMVQLSPDNGVAGWDWCSGYHYSSDKIVGFSHTHLSGTGIGDMLDIAFMPRVATDETATSLVSKFFHTQEKALAGYYSVTLQDSKINVELTTTKRSGFHRYEFPLLKTGERACVSINLGQSFNWDTPTETRLVLESKTVVSGYRKSTGWAKDQHVYFVAEFSKPFQNFKVHDHSVSEEVIYQGQRVRGDLFFDLKPNEKLLVKVGISPTSIEGAKKNLQKEIPHWDFEKTKTEAKEAWNRELNRVRLKTEDNKLKTIFYTALYHAYLAPTLFCDVDGSYRGPDGKVHQASFENYTTFSLWDTFRAEHPLLTIFRPEMVDDLVQSMMAFYREHGLLPVWSLMGNETNTMIGYHSIPVIVDAIQKGLTKIDAKEALAAMKKSALQDAGGLRYYKMPEPTTVDQLYKTLERNDIKPIERERKEKPFQLPEGFVAGYAKTISGPSIGYHSNQANVNQALIARTKKGEDVIEWETAPIPAGAKRKEVSFAWLAGVDIDKDGRRFDFYVNGEKWFEFNAPKESSQNAWQVKAANGATLNFYATHIDRFGDHFGYMWLTVPIEALKTNTLRLKVVGQDANDDDWFMAFEHTLANRMTVSNVYALVNVKQKSNSTTASEFDFDDSIKQVVRIDVENIDTPCKAKIEFQITSRYETSFLNSPAKLKEVVFDLASGLNTFFITLSKATRTYPYKITLKKTVEQDLTRTFTLYPIQPFNYLPADFENESVSKTLEYAFDDWCIAQLAKRLDQKEDYKLFSERAQFYRNLFDKETGFMRGRLSDGSWKTPFSPKFSSHRQDEYTEGNAWQYSWFVPHDAPGLIELMGGREAFVKKLDQLFNESSVIEGSSASPDISGLIGQYAHGNEPSHHIAYLYALAGQHWKTQERVRQITSMLYNDTTEGLCGNEDCGQMSAWYIFSALGFYPVNPASGIYVIGTPHFEKVEITVDQGKIFSVIASNLSDTNKYIQSVTLNGKVLRAPFIRHKDIMRGGKLVFEMGSKPNGKLFQ